MTGVSKAQTSLVAWDFNGYSAYGASPQTPTTSSPNLTVVGLTRGAGVGTAPTAASNAWGGGDWNAGVTLITTANAAIADGAFATFTVTPNTGYKFSLSGISAYNVRRSGTGPTTGQWQYSIDGTSFTNIGSSITWGATTSSAGNGQAAIDLSTVTALQDVAAGTTVTFRVVNWGASGTGTWYFNNLATAGNDLVINGTVTSVGVDLSPTVVAPFSPADGATAALIGSNLVATFSENIVTIPASPGAINIYKTTGPTLVESFSITSPRVTVSGNILTIDPTANLTYGTDYYVTIDTGMVEDITGNDFTGINNATDWNFTTEPAPAPPAVVINKYLNGTPDTVELLVVGSGVTGTTWNLSGMVIKDFSSNMTGDGGGKYIFTNNSLWSAVPVGTLIVLSKSAVSTDTSTAGFNLSVGLDDATYFTNDGGSFDIATTDMVMIKSSGSVSAGLTGGIHALAGGAEGSLFSTFTGAKLISSGTTGTGLGAIATNSTSTITDYSGTGATSASLTAVDFGVPNNLANVTYVYSLRGTTPGDGSGLATITNATVGSFTGKNIFDASQTDNQSVKIALNAQVPGVTLTDLEITVPAEMGVPTGATVTGAGAGAPVSVTSGQTVTISGLALTSVNLVEVELTALDTPVTTAASNGNLPFIIKTAKSGGTLTNITTQPIARVIIPIEALRDVDANGVTLDAGTIVAIQGVCTEAQFYTTNTLAVLQDGNFGVSIFFSSPTGNPFVRAKRYAVLGSVGQFNGVTQVTPTSFSNVVDLGTAAEPAPLVITIPDLLATPEIYEGRLVTVQNISRAPGDTTWGSAAVASTAVNMLDTASPTPNSIPVLITNNSGAFTAPPAAADITGIFSQNDNSSPYSGTYQLLPRAQADVLSLGSAYDLWIGGYYSGVTDPLIVGFTADPDLDGIANGVEALIGGNPSQFGFFAATDLVKSGNVFTFLYPQARNVPSGVTAAYEWSADLLTWYASGQSDGATTVSLSDGGEPYDDDGVSPTRTYKVTATVTVGTPAKLFVRVVAHN